jgi:hypothetical protein
MSKKVLYILIPLIIGGIFLWSSGFYALWSVGMGAIANNTMEYSDKDGHLINGKYKLEIDLSDLESNIGKEIYNDGKHRIYVFWLQKVRSGGLDIGFRSSGQYSLSAATLVSGLQHETVDHQNFRSLTTAKLLVEYSGLAVNAEVTGQCGINYKDGDCFSYTFFLSEEPNEAITNSEIISLTITDLYKNIWRRK